MAAKKQVRKKKRERKHVERGQAHIQSTFNNTLITLTDMDGNALSWCSFFRPSASTVFFCLGDAPMVLLTKVIFNVFAISLPPILKFLPVSYHDALQLRRWW